MCTEYPWIYVSATAQNKNTQGLLSELSISCCKCLYKAYKLSKTASAGHKSCTGTPARMHNALPTERQKECENGAFCEVETRLTERTFLHCKSLLLTSNRSATTATQWQMLPFVRTPTRNVKLQIVRSPPVWLPGRAECVVAHRSHLATLKSRTSSQVVVVLIFVSFEKKILLYVTFHCSSKMPPDSTWTT